MTAEYVREPWQPKFMAWGLTKDLPNWWMVDDVTLVDATTIKVTLDTGQVFWITVTEQYDGQSGGDDA